MNILSFRFYALNEAAKYGFPGEGEQILGGTDPMPGDTLFARIDTDLVITELSGMPSIGNLPCIQKWDDTLQWGTEAGAVKTNITPSGSIKVMTTRLCSSLHGEPTWILKSVYPLKDDKDQKNEAVIAQKVYDGVKKILSTELESASSDYDGVDRLAQKLWHTTKKQHPGYIMFPTNLWKQRENYYKLVYEFRGQGAGSPFNGKTGRAEQFDIDLVYEPGNGFIRCIGYDIDSSMRQHSWQVQTPEWDVRFSPKQEESEIIECIVKMFLQY